MARNTTKQVKLTPETHSLLKRKNRSDEYLGETIARGLQTLSDPGENNAE